MCRAELLTWQWDSEVSRRFQRLVLLRDLGPFPPRAGISLSLPFDLGITPRRFHEQHRANPRGRRVEPSAKARAASRGISVAAQTCRIGIFEESLAGISDGSGLARRLHGVSLRLWCVV